MLINSVIGQQMFCVIRIFNETTIGSLSAEIGSFIKLIYNRISQMHIFSKLKIQTKNSALVIVLGRLVKLQALFNGRSPFAKLCTRL